jgi:hypothetical protein
MYTYHIFLIHSSVVGHMGCFHSLAIVNSASEVNTCNCKQQVSLLNHDLYSLRPSGISLGVELLDHMAVLLVVF